MSNDTDSDSTSDYVPSDCDTIDSVDTLDSYMDIEETGSSLLYCDQHEEQYVCELCVNKYLKWCEEDELQNHNEFIDDSDMIL
jgi:hypothetical protein